MVKSIISVDKLTKKFSGLNAVDEISFDVKEGEFFGFVGPNGAGKTTTINMLCTLIRPTAGTANVAGYDVASQSSKVRENIGLVFQDTTLDDRLTAWENLEFHSVVYHVPARERKQRIDHVFDLVELSNHKNDVISTFSGGMKRRLEVARGLLHSPRVLFLDEPTIGLDPQTRRRIWDYLARLRSETNMTIFLTTHYLDEAEPCDRVGIIDHGKLIVIDTPNALKSRVGADVIHLSTTDDEKMKNLLETKYDVTVKDVKGELAFEKENAEEFLIRVVEDFKPYLTSIGVRRPTLDDVFLKLTGREIRDEDVPPKHSMSSIASRVKGGR